MQQHQLQKQWGVVHTNTSGLFAGIFETAIDAIIAIDERGKIESFNPAAERLFGYAANEAVGLNVRALMPSPDREAHDGYLENYRRTGKRKIIGSGREVTAQHKSGQQIPIHLSLSEADVGGRRVFVGMCRDITELVRARAEVEAARLRSDAVLDTAADGILTIDAQGIVQSFNRAAERLFNYTKSEMLGANVNRLMPTAIAMQHDGYLKHTLKTGERKIIGIGREVVARRRDGSSFPAWLSVSHFRVADSDYFTGIVRDISELRQKELLLKDLNRQLSDRGWFSERQLELNNVTRGTANLADACQALVDTLARQVGAVAAVGYLAEEAEGTRLVAVAGYAFPRDRKLGTTIWIGQGLLGQAVRDGSARLVELSAGQFAVESSFGGLMPSHLALIPVVYNDIVVGAFELAMSSHPDARVVRYLENLPLLCAAILGAIRDQERIRVLLSQSQAQTEELRAQQEETAAAKEQLEEQKIRLEGINAALVQARAELEEKADALQKTGRYKSEFLANMSHELRTPLNSVLVLAKVLLENRAGNLSQDQVESLRVIDASGTDLLDLINDILDLSKVEAGKLRFAPANVATTDLLTDLQRMFRPLMEAKKLQFTCTQEPSAPASLYTDSLRLQQVLRNLLSNANKFTERGSVTLRVSGLAAERRLRGALLRPGEAIVFEVEDTGIGIPVDKQEIIFQAFQQVESTLNRRFGGTGLGLSISKSLAEHLGGELRVHSSEGQGSRFALVLPVRHEFAGMSRPERDHETALGGGPVAATQGYERAVPRAVLQAEPRPAVVLLSDAALSRSELKTSLQAEKVKVTVVASVDEAMDACRAQTFTGVIVESASGVALARRFFAAAQALTIVPPVVVYTRDELTRADALELTEFSPIVIVDGERAFHRLLQELRSLNKRGGALGSNLAAAPERDLLLATKCVLVVDDDLRNVFALRALLSSVGMQVVVAESGLEAVEQFGQRDDIDCVLMDIMMPHMDGYAAMQRLRALPNGSEIPIIALTAKAMPEDRRLCLEAGASDYLSKPVNNDELLGLLRAWLT